MELLKHAYQFIAVIWTLIRPTEFLIMNYQSIYYVNEV